MSLTRSRTRTRTPSRSRTRTRTRSRSRTHSQSRSRAIAYLAMTSGRARTIVEAYQELMKQPELIHKFKYSVQEVSFAIHKILSHESENSRSRSSEAMEAFKANLETTLVEYGSIVSEAKTQSRSRTARSGSRSRSSRTRSSRKSAQTRAVSIPRAPERRFEWVIGVMKTALKLVASVAAGYVITNSAVKASAFAYEVLSSTMAIKLLQTPNMQYLLNNSKFSSYFYYNAIATLSAGIFMTPLSTIFSALKSGTVASYQFTMTSINAITSAISRSIKTLLDSGFGMLFLNFLVSFIAYLYTLN